MSYTVRDGKIEDSISKKIEGFFGSSLVRQICVLLTAIVVLYLFKNVTLETKLSNVRAFARKVGLNPPRNLQGFDSELHDDTICSSDDCMSAALRLIFYMNPKIDPCEDFYEFSCGGSVGKKFLEKLNDPSMTVSRVVVPKSPDHTQDILESPKDVMDIKPINQAKEYYSLCMNKNEWRGLRALRNILKDYGDWPLLIGRNWNETHFNLEKTLGDMKRQYTVSALISISVSKDIQSVYTYQNIIYVSQPSTVLPRYMLLNKEGKYDAQRTAYKEYIVNSAKEFDKDKSLSDSDLESAAKDVIDFEIALASIMAPEHLQRDVNRTYNKFSLSKYQETLPGAGINLTLLLETVFSTTGIEIIPQESIIVEELDYMNQLMELLVKTPKSTVANYLNVKLVYELGPETTEEMNEHFHNLQEKVFNTPKPTSRVAGCIKSTTEFFGKALGVKYFEKQGLDEESKIKANELITNLRSSFKHILMNSTWMDNPTKENALLKLNKMKVILGYPDWWKNTTEVEAYYSGVEQIMTQVHFQNKENLQKWMLTKKLNELRYPLERNNWFRHSGEVNAFHDVDHNTIAFPAGILQKRYFLKNQPAYLNYGGIGTIIGHEITHGFDNMGRQFDGNGNQFDWWTPESTTKFNEKAKCIQNQYNSYVADVDGEKLQVDGKLTLGENIADNGGLGQAFQAYQRFVKKSTQVEQRLPGLEQFEPNQLFFLAFASVWCEDLKGNELKNQMLTDEHPPGKFRVRGSIENNEDFGKVWNCPLGSPMNPRSVSKCPLW